MEALSAYTDLHGLANLKSRVRQGASEESVSEVAAQFASVFTHMMLKSMRQASLGDGLFDSEQSLFYRDLFDQELAVALSTRDGTGIAHLIETHLARMAGNGQTAEPGEQPLRARTATGQYLEVQALTRATAAASNGPEADIQEPDAPADTVDSRTRTWMGRASAR